MKLSVKCLLILMCLGLPVAAQAACNRYPNSQNSVSFPSTITVPESLGVGQLITSQTFAGPYPTFYMYCHSPTPTFLTGRFSTAVSAPGGLIYHTNVPGIGMRVMVTLTSGAPYSAKLRTESLVSAPGNILWGATRLVAQFYKLGPVTTGTLPSGEIQHNNWDGGKGHYRMILNTSIRFVNPATTCDLATGDVNRTITLPTVRVSDFNDGVNTGARDFELTANCKSASSVTFRFTGTPASGNPTLFANTGSATGVAVWLYSRISGAPQTISHNGTRTVAVSSNRAVLPLGAAYHRNGTVGQGTLASTATVNITYN
ncbi:fimbrial protein [Pseudomonas sp. WS 5106]|uniref:Fimbrial protein n=1 Tax=Pseudomonas cremoris TaxID=2724178 RepID=A0A7X1AJ43_9PSED|nr:fimbrial protein [Pseudomonas cremoris]MBC2380274.1 fimbrial protein [Pseudomonas cremoris]MBC2405375.1 fimbrial protein [Pseudomonas cremoris]